MPYYSKAGKIPSKRHIVFRKKDNSLFQEELVGTQGFAGNSSLVYHLYPPTIVTRIESSVSLEPKIAVKKGLKARSFKTFNIEGHPDYLKSRKTLLVNNDLYISIAAPQKSVNYFYKNADADEMIFIHKGSGKLKTIYGNIPFEYGDYLVIPRGTIYQIEFNETDNKHLVIESFSAISLPRKYRNDYGQLQEHSPFCERDIKIPTELKTHDEHGEFDVMIKKQGILYHYVYGTHPFDAVGWDGYQYPYAFSIHNFEPITGRLHMPPPIHQTFEGNNFVVCSFVPRMYDYHPQAIPAPYHHSNIDSDEILYYVDGDFMSRNNIEKGQITLHPGGIPHGPHPGAIERSIGKKETNEIAVMIDPFKPLMVTEEALKLEVKDYYKSWITQPEKILENGSR